MPSDEPYEEDTVTPLLILSTCLATTCALGLAFKLHRRAPLPSQPSSASTSPSDPLVIRDPLISRLVKVFSQLDDLPDQVQTNVKKEMVNFLTHVNDLITRPTTAPPVLLLLPPPPPAEPISPSTPRTVARPSSPLPAAAPSTLPAAAPSTLPAAAPSTPLERFRKMLKVGIPPGAVEAKMRAEGLDPSLLSAPPAPAADATLSRFAQMLKVGVPRGAVEAKMRTEGLDPSRLFPSSPGPKPKPAVASTPAKPAAPRKVLRWEVIADERVTGNSVWAVAGPSLSPEEMLRFSKHAQRAFKPQSKERRVDDENRAPNAQSQSLLPARRAQNLAIGLARVKKSPKAVCAALQTLDVGALSVDALNALQRLGVTKDELGVFAQLTQEPQGEAEKLLFYVAHDVPDFCERVEALLFEARFDGTATELGATLSQMRALCGRALTSECLPSLLQCAVLTGRVLNSDGSTKAVSVLGLGDALALAKSPDGSCTAADLVAGLASRLCPGWDLACFEGVDPSLAVPAVSKEVEDLVCGVERTARLMAKSRPADGFSAKARASAETLKAEAAALRIDFAAVLARFGELPDTHYGVFFQAVARFAQVLSKGHKAAVWDPPPPSPGASFWQS